MFPEWKKKVKTAWTLLMYPHNLHLTLFWQFDITVSDGLDGFGENC